MRLTFVALGLPLALLSACANTANSTSAPLWVDDNSSLISPGTLSHAPAPLVTATYDGSGQAVEPTVLFFPDGWGGHLYWMVMSPYPYSNPKFENPSILVSNDGQNWIVPPGLGNPLWLPEQGIFADSTIAYDDSSREMSVYFLNDVVRPGKYQESLLRTTSTDGVHWTAPQILLSGRNTIFNSPSVTKVGSTFYLWTVDTGVGCTTQTSTVYLRTSLDGAAWSSPQSVSLNQPGFVIWHLNVIAIPSEGQFMSLIAAYPVGCDCGCTQLFFANSNDGLSWKTYPRPIMIKGSGWDSGNIYRSSLLYDPASGLFRVWYSAVSAAGEWHIGYTQKTFFVDAPSAKTF